MTSPRSLHWYRGYTASGGYISDSYLTVPLPAPAGSTLVRLHYQLVAQQRGAVTFANLPQRNPVLGVMCQDGSIATPPDGPITNPQQDWLHYELLSPRPVMYTITSPSYALTVWPEGDPQRDIKAQRRPDLGGGIQLWWRWESVGTSQAVVFVELAYAALVEWPVIGP